MSAGKSVSEHYAPLLAKSGALVIDNSSCWRHHDDIPLVVPEVNSHAIARHKGIIANPNCSTIQSVVALHSLHKHYGIRRIVYNTYQAVSGAGNSALSQLHDKSKFHDNAIPHIDVFCEDGYTREERKMIFETQKILEAEIAITATTVRVPVEYGHSISINVTLDRPSELKDIVRLMQGDENIVFLQDGYHTPQIARGTDAVYVSRLRVDNSAPNSYNMWVVADNIRKGAATNALQIAKCVVENDNR
jgi:aspartate-semialdehyde dehydrogenase